MVLFDNIKLNTYLIFSCIVNPEKKVTLSPDSVIFLFYLLYVDQSCLPSYHCFLICHVKPMYCKLSINGLLLNRD